MMGMGTPKSQSKMPRPMMSSMLMELSLRRSITRRTADWFLSGRRENAAISGE